VLLGNEGIIPFLYHSDCSRRCINSRLKQRLNPPNIRYLFTSRTPTVHRLDPAVKADLVVESHSFL